MNKQNCTRKIRVTIYIQIFEACKFRGCHKSRIFAILFSNQIDNWPEPNQQAELLFSLHEGTKVEVLDILENWKKIRIANGSEGWIENASIRYLNNEFSK